jgi:ABC-type branched-subunit amino acid transport system substrate-binding protein
MKSITRGRRVVAVLAAVTLIGTVLAACSSGTSSAATTTSNSGSSGSKTASPSSDGVWPGLGKICGQGSGGGTTARGVSSKSINIATFADPGNTVEPGLNKEFFEAATAFSQWCNAAGGIDGRRIVVHDRDAALFNAAQVTTQACQQDFMSVGGGMALDQPSVPVRVGCGLGQISGFTVSSQAVDAALQVNPGGTSNTVTSAGWYSALGKKYPKAVKHYGYGGQNEPSILDAAENWKKAALAQGWKLVDWQEPPLTVTDWTPYIEQAQSKGVQALQPSDDSAITPYVQAMNTAGYDPAFMLLTTQFYERSTVQAAAQAHFPTTYVATQYWPFELASQSPGLQQLEAIMHKYSSGSSIDWDDELAFDSWVLFAKSATACGAKLTDSCVLSKAASERNWSGGGLTAPVTHLAMSNANPTPSACFVLLNVEPNKFVYNKVLTDPNNKIWNCNPSGLVRVSGNGS